VDEAIEAISQYGEFEQFVSDVNWIDVPEGSDEELPFPLNNDMAA
jgi:hypothetical protein